MKRIREWFNITTVKTPKLIVLLGILAANLFFISVAALVIMWLAPPSLESTDYWSCVYYAVSMLLSGYMEIVVEDIGRTGALCVLFCVFTVILGMVAFTGAIIGYVTEFISSFVENADSGSRRLCLSDHIVMLNWNTRAAEIINELLYKNKREKVVILVENNRDDVLGDIDERLSDTMEAEKKAVMEASAHMGFWERRRYIRRYGIRNRLTVIVREGDAWSTKQLNDISIKLAKSVIILSENVSSMLDGSANKGHLDPIEKRNARTVKTLIQIAQMTSAEDSANDQQVIVEVEDGRTLELVNMIIEHKARKGKCNIVPVAINQILGLIFSQFSIMPELNIVYSTLFSNKGAAFYTQSSSESLLSEPEYVSEYLDTHLQAIPLAVTRGGDGKQNCYYMSDDERHIHSSEPAIRNEDLRVSINPDFEIKDKHVIILGHNSKSTAIMEGFDAFCKEWKNKEGTEVLDVTVIDDELNLMKRDHYQQHPCVQKVIAADIFDKDLICNVIDEFIGAHSGDGCIMILSDDTVSGEEIDAEALTYLILVQDVLRNRVVSDPGFDRNAIDMVVEILNPKNFDIVSNYSTNNIVISDRYISKIIMQIGEKDSLFDFYYDILTYDEPDAEGMASKELYIKKAAEFFNGIPAPCTAADLIRAVYFSSPDDNKSIVLGYFRPDGEMILFEGDQSMIQVTLSKEDKLILYSNH